MQTLSRWTTRGLHGRAPETSYILAPSLLILNCTSLIFHWTFENLDTNNKCSKGCPGQNLSFTLRSTPMSLLSSLLHFWLPRVSADPSNHLCMWGILVHFELSDLSPHLFVVASFSHYLCIFRSVGRIVDRLFNGIWPEAPFLWTTQFSFRLSMKKNSVAL